MVIRHMPRSGIRGKEVCPGTIIREYVGGIVVIQCVRAYGANLQSDVHFSWTKLGLLTGGERCTR